MAVCGCSMVVSMRECAGVPSRFYFRWFHHGTSVKLDFTTFFTKWVPGGAPATRRGGITTVVMLELVPKIVSVPVLLLVVRRVACPPVAPEAVPVAPPVAIEVTTSTEGYVVVRRIFTPDSLQVPVSLMHSIARADVVFVAPVPPAEERVPTAGRVGTIAVSDV